MDTDDGHESITWMTVSYLEFSNYVLARDYIFLCLSTLNVIIFLFYATEVK